MQENEQYTEKMPPAEQHAGFLISLFTGWGVPGGLARILAGAVLGALSALWALSQSGCLAEWSQSAHGATTSWQGRLALPPVRTMAEK